jgi:ketosteroid isomerase-like protein
MLNNQSRMALKLPTIALLALGFVYCSPLNYPSALAAETKETKIAKDTKDTKDECDVTCVDPHAACVESQKVIDTLHEMAKAINKGDFEHFAEYFDENVTTFDDITKQLLVGKKQVIARIKERYEQSVQASEAHAVSYTIYQPYAKVHGNTATVTCVLRKVMGGKHPVVFESHDTKVFVKEGDKWKELHSQGLWKKVSS